jgi:uncharacterized phage protein (TIGR01671 family)
MREILFRGKLIEKYQNAGAWKYGSLLITADGAYHIFVLPSFTFDVDAATVGQYTGIEDKNGERVFEGDIVEIEFINTDDPRLVCFLGESRRGIIEYRKSGFGTKTVNLSDDNYRFKVIGNIYDTPELPGGEKGLFDDDAKRS